MNQLKLYHLSPCLLQHLHLDSTGNKLRQSNKQNLDLSNKVAQEHSTKLEVYEGIKKDMDYHTKITADMFQGGNKNQAKMIQIITHCKKLF